MRFSTALACATALLTPTAFGLSLFESNDNTAIAFDDDRKIPGESPLELCKKDHDDDILTIEKVDLDPNPPKAGQQLLIKAKGNFHKKVVEGAYVKLTVKYGLIRLLTTKASLCEQIGNVDLECPLEPGDRDISKSVDLPKEIPPGKYTVEADVYTKDDEAITCLTATVTFSVGGFVQNEL